MFHFGKIQEEVLSNAVGRVYQHPEQKVYLSISGMFQKKKQAVWLKKCPCKYTPLKFLGNFVLEILEKPKVIARVIP